VAYGNGSFAFVCTYPQACVLFTPGSCPNGEECHIKDGPQGTVVCSAPSGSQVPEGGECEYLNDCGDSLQCTNIPPDGVDAGAGSSCRYNCKVDTWQTLEPGLGGCPANQTCDDFEYAALPNIGICRPN
jgi:hypothetical protein